MECRNGCGACCIAPSISSSLPGMPNGKPTVTPCIHLTETYSCGIYDHPDRPKVCELFKADSAVCGVDREEALILLSMLEEGEECSASGTRSQAQGVRHKAQGTRR